MMRSRLTRSRGLRRPAGRPVPVVPEGAGWVHARRAGKHSGQRVRVRSSRGNVDVRWSAAPGERPVARIASPFWAKTVRLEGITVSGAIRSACGPAGRRGDCTRIPPRLFQLPLQLDRVADRLSVRCHNAGCHGSALGKRAARHEWQRHISCAILGHSRSRRF